MKSPNIGAFVSQEDRDDLDLSDGESEDSDDLSRAIGSIRS